MRNWHPHKFIAPRELCYCIVKRDIPAHLLCSAPACVAAHSSFPRELTLQVSGAAAPALQRTWPVLELGFRVRERESHDAWQRQDDFTRVRQPEGRCHATMQNTGEDLRGGRGGKTS
jgi:hypothetical protein